ncbi:MAG: hypothetical protein LBM38_01300 [Clostridiales bacterium]|jgi:hypothetical protein|nr:hypothetical protein [Clostridiales bacterium]
MKKLLSVLFIILFGVSVIALGITQLLLVFPEGRDALYSRAENVGNANNIALGELTLALNGEPSDNIKVLQNGKVIALFNKPTITITVSDNSVIEIDSSADIAKTDENSKRQVMLHDVSANVILAYNYSPIEIKSGVSTLCRVIIKN